MERRGRGRRGGEMKEEGEKERGKVMEEGGGGARVHCHFISHTNTSELFYI